MSWIDFDTFRVRLPELAFAWDRLEEWTRNNPSVRFLEITRLADELYPISAWELTQSLEALASAGAVEPWLRVQDPTGVFVEGKYKRLEEIPREMSDRLHQYMFSVSPRNVVPVYYYPEAIGNRS